MKIERLVCDVCDNNREATRTLKVFSREGRVTRGAPKAMVVEDLCDYCYDEFVVLFEAMHRTANQ